MEVMCFLITLKQTVTNLIYSYSGQKLIIIIIDNLL